MNPYRGEVSLVVDGAPRAMRLSLGALAELEAALGEDSLLAMVERFETGSFRSADLISLLLAGMRGAGQPMERETLVNAAIEGGPMAAAKAGALLLKRAFSVADEAL